MSAGDPILIVNADDLGRTPGINEGIFSAHRDGIVTSATLMVGFHAAADAAAEWRSAPDFGIGLHLTLTGSKPLSDPAEVPSLVDGEGRFPAKPEGHRAPALAEVVVEARAQLERFRELTGRLPTHFDSHHHSHRIPAVLEALIVLARETGLPIRNPSPEGAARLQAAGVATTDRFVERFFGSEATLETLLEILDDLPPGTTELMCHPARVDDDLRRHSSYLDDRERELAVLTSPEAREAVASRGIRLATFAEACGS